jgi:hypothetical protein|tara:strand:- start:7291 stop:7908 length:618 start_codon:yes stop_codon:yes gene_type:complete
MSNIIIFTNAFITKLYNDIQSWAYTNSIVQSASGWTVGYSTYHFITGLLLLGTPLINSIQTKITNMGEIIGIEKSGYIYLIITFIINIFILILTWLITLLIAFLLLEYIFNNRFLGLKSNIKVQEKTDFIIAKATVNSPNKTNIIEDTKKIEKKNYKEKIIGEKIVKKEEEALENISKFSEYEIEVDDELNLKNKEYSNIIENLI